MKAKIMNVLKYLMFIIIPFLSVVLCRVFRTAQGESTEEIAFGILLGLVLDFIYAIYLLVAKKISKAQKTKRIIVYAIFSIVVVVILVLSLSNPIRFGRHTYQSAKDYSEAFLNRNQEELEEIAQEVLKTKQTSISEYKKAESINYNEFDDAVYFDIDAQGMLGGQYWSLVYTEKGNFRGETDKYAYYEKDGNNIIFAEKIKENWYFYWIDYDGREDLSNIK